MAPLRRTRMNKGLSVQELADIAGVSERAIVRTELGRGQPVPETIHRICQALGVTPGEVDEFRPPSGSRVG